MAKKDNEKAKKDNEKAAESDKTKASSGDLAVADRPHVIEPFGWMSDWFEHWPPMLGRRMPDLFERGIGTMRVEEFLEDDTTVVRVEIPGVDPDSDIDISVVGGKLTISATREQRRTDTENDYRSEFHYGSFRRTMTLPMGVDADDITATYEDGILEIRVPVGGEAEAKTKVPIGRGAPS